MSRPSRSFIAALQISLDGYVQGAAGEVDWVPSWDGALGLIRDVDAAVIGGGTYPGYEQLWGSIAADPPSGTAMLGRPPTEGEVEYAQWTQRTVHYVVSSAIDKVSWETARLVRDVSELRSVKQQPGGTVYVIGGGALVSSLMNEGLIDELALIVQPVILGSGKGLFAGIKDRQAVELLQSSSGPSGQVVLRYRVQGAGGPGNES